MERTASEELQNTFLNAINTHGYGFQYRILREIEELVRDRLLGWKLVGTEVPVAVGSHETRIDFILSRKDANSGGTTLLLAECKRANPAIANWCFAESSYYQTPCQYMIVDCVRLGVQNLVYPVVATTAHNHLHVHVETKTDKKGDATGSSKGAIESAFKQSMVGLNGTINSLSRLHQAGSEDETRYFLVPVIFTTASLWVSSEPLDSADLKTGNLATTELSPASWVLYHYDMSPGMKHAAQIRWRRQDVFDHIMAHQCRSVGIVSVDGIFTFLRAMSALDVGQDNLM